MQPRLPLILAFLVAIVSGLPVQAQDGAGATWVIDGVELCEDDTMVAEGPIEVMPGGALILEGCTLQVDSPPYENKWLGAKDEGLTVHVHPGGRLELRHSEDRPAAIEAFDDRYGYYLVVEGTFASNGLPGDHNTVRGLEGYMAESFMGGGLTVIGDGRAYANHTTFQDIFGPALLARDGGEAYARDVTVRKASGAFASVNGTLSVDGADLNTGIESIRVSRSTLTLHNVSAGTQRIAVHATDSQVTLRDSTLQASGNSMVLVDSDADIQGCRFKYGVIGLIHQPKVGSDRQGAVRVRDCVIEAAVPGEESLGISIDQADLDLADSRLSNNTAGGLTVRAGVLKVANVEFSNDAETDVFGLDPTGIELPGNSYSEAAQKPVRIMYTVDIEVRSEGEPASGARVDMEGVLANTTSDGKAQLVWEPPLGQDMLPTTDSVSVAVFWHDDRMEKDATPGDRSLHFNFGEGGWGVPPQAAAWTLVAAAVAAGGIVVVQRMRKKPS